MPGLLIDITRLLYRRMKGRLPTGIDRVALEYVRHFAGRGRAVLSYGRRTLVLPGSLSARAFGALVNGVARAPMARQGAGTILINTGHYGLENPGYAAPLRRRGARPVVFVHDLIPIAHPEYCRGGEAERHARRIRTALGIASGIIVNSQDTLGKLRGYAVSSGLSCPPVLVAPLASSLPAAAPGPRPVAEPYFVMLGTIEPRKNHALLLAVWRRLAGRLGKDAPRLLLVGQRGWECEQVCAMLDSGEFRDSVIERANCTDGELAGLLQHARALLLPSFAEGYGLPAVEALSAGVPVLASDLAVFREFAGGVPDYLDPRDADAWTEAIADYAAEGSARRAAQMQRLASWRAPTWSEHLRSVEDFIGQLPQ